MTLGGSSVKAAIVTVGDELLLGETVDTNAAWLGRRLALKGIDVVRRHTVADDAHEIRRAVSDALDHARLVVVSGGLGPTPDDLTREAVAELLDAPLALDEALLERLAERFREVGYDDLPETNRSQALVPEGATTLANPHGTAPGLVLEAPGDGLVVLLPGVPRELKGIFDGELTRFLERRLGDRLPPVHIRMIRTTGIPESLLAQKVGEVLPADTGPVSVAFLPDGKGVDLRLTARGVEAEEAGRWLDRVEEALEPVVGRWRFDAESGDVVEALTRVLRDRSLTLAVAESCTGGLVGQRITARAGASDVFLGGVVAYADGVKEDLLDVPAEVLEAHGAVSEEVARAMARGVRARFGASTGISITGVAGPGGGTEEKPVGTVCFAAAVEDGVATRRARFPGDRASVRERSAQAAIFLLLRLLEGRVEPDAAEED